MIEFLTPHIPEFLALCAIAALGLALRLLWLRWKKEQARANRALKLLNEVGEKYQNVKDKESGAELDLHRLSAFLIAHFKQLPIWTLVIGPQHRPAATVLKGHPVDVASDLLRTHPDFEAAPEPEDKTNVE